jgi:hypothetical protein
VSTWRLVLCGAIGAGFALAFWLHWTTPLDPEDGDDWQPDQVPFDQMPWWIDTVPDEVEGPA